MKWAQVKLGDISRSIQTGPFGSQLHQSDYTEDGIPVVMPKDLDGGHISEDSIARVGIAHVNRLYRHKIESGDILYSRRGDVGRCAYATEKENGWLCGTGCLRVTINPELANSKFVFYQLQRPETVGWMVNHAIGATMLNLNTTILSSVPIGLPDLDAQNRTVHVLSQYDSLIENNQRQIKLLEEAARRLYREWFVDLRFPGHEHVQIVNGVPKGWRLTTVGEICKLRKETVSPDKINIDTPYIGLEHIPRRDFCLSAWGTSNDVNSQKYTYAENDIIFGQIRPYFHKVGFAVNNGVASTDSFIMQPDSKLWAVFLMTVSDSAFVNYAYQTCKEGSKMPRADWRQLQKYPICVAPENLQAKFERFIRIICDKIKRIVFMNHDLSEARDRLLPKLMSGEIEL